MRQAAPSPPHSRPRRCWIAGSLRSKAILLLGALIWALLGPPPAAAGVSEQKLIPAGVGDMGLAGWSVASAPGTFVLGAPLEEGSRGALHIFRFLDGEWTESQQLEATSRAPGDLFGWSVALEGDLLAVGAPFSLLGKGAVFVYHREAGAWQLAQILTPSGIPDFSAFGLAVALDDGDILVGAPLHPFELSLEAFRGTSFLFTKNSGLSWTGSTRLERSAPVGGGLFGSSVALDSGTALVGSPGALGGSGAGYVFVRSSGGWSEQAELVPAGGRLGGEAGSSVALDGGTALLGAPGDDLEAGAVYAFGRSAGTWHQQQRLQSGRGLSAPGFGWSLALEGNTAVVSSLLGNEIEIDDDGTVLSMVSGSVDIFSRDGGPWTRRETLLAEPGPADGFGVSVALQGDQILVGTPGDSTAGPLVGAAYLFTMLGDPSGTGCSEGPTSLCLGDGRFEARARWRTPQGDSGAGQVQRLTDDTGYFWFFNPANVEVVVKVLDACAPPFGRFWVFAAGLTDVEVELTVTDTETGDVWQRVNPLSTAFPPIQDTQAFATCP